MSDSKDLAKSLASETFTTLLIGNKIFVGAVCSNGKPFVFTPKQAAFLIALHKMKSLHAAALSVGETEDWGNNFLRSRKFGKFRDGKLEEARVKAGLTIEYLMLWNRWAMDGKKTWWDAQCTNCGLQDEWTEYQVAACRTDSMELTPECVICFKLVTLTYREIAFSPTREMNEQWKEAAARIWPKVDRVQHEFTAENFTFLSADEESAA